MLVIKKGFKNPAYVTYRSVHEYDVHKKADVSVSNHVPMNSVSAGHPVIGKPIRNVAEARKMMKRAAGFDLEKEEKPKVKTR